MVRTQRTISDLYILVVLLWPSVSRMFSRGEFSLTA